MSAKLPGSSGVVAADGRSIERASGWMPGAVEHVHSDTQPQQTSAPLEPLHHRSARFRTRR
jgi:hypothetical protein